MKSKHTLRVPSPELRDAQRRKAELIRKARFSCISPETKKPGMLYW